MPLSGHTVFVIGPASSLRQDVFETLRAYRPTVFVYDAAPDAQEALTQVRPRLIIWVAPGLEQIAAVRRFRAQAPEATLIAVLEAGSEKTLTEHLRAAGFHHCVLSSRQGTLGTTLETTLSALTGAPAGADDALPPNAVGTLAELALTSAPIEIVLDYAVHATARTLHAEFCRLLERRSEDRFVLRAEVGWDKEVETPVATDEAAQEQFVLRTNAPVVVDDLAQETRFTPPATLVERGILSGASTVIEGMETPYGVLSVYACRRNAFTPDDVRFLAVVSSVLTGILARRHAEEALQEVEARARAILETTVDAIITIDERGRIESFNQAAERIFGYIAEEVTGQNVHVLMPEPFQSEHDTYIQNYLETGRRKIIGIGREVTGKRKDGTVFPMELAVSEVLLRDRRIFTGIVRDITERRHLEQEVLRVSEQERRRIGQDLHDGLGQMLTGLHLISRNLARRLENHEAEGAEEVTEIAEMVKEADQYARGLARGLVPVELEQGGLRGALERLARNAERLFGITCTFEEHAEQPIEDTTTTMHLYRIAQEAVSNAVRHGKADRVTILLAAGRDRVRLRVQDNGRGFTNPPLPSLSDDLEERRGMGVRIMHYRARIIGASLDIQGAPNEGTTITCTLRRHGETPARSLKPRLREITSQHKGGQSR